MVLFKCTKHEVQKTKSETRKEPIMLTLNRALETSEIEVAEQYLSDCNVVVESNEDGGYDVKVQIGAMPPHSSTHVETIEQAEQEIAHLHGYTADGWYAVEGE